MVVSKLRDVTQAAQMLINQSETFTEKRREWNIKKC